MDCSCLLGRLQWVAGEEMGVAEERGENKLEWIYYDLQYVPFRGWKLGMDGNKMRNLV